MDPLPIIEFHQHDAVPAFAAFAPDATDDVIGEGVIMAHEKIEIQYITPPSLPDALAVLIKEVRDAGVTLEMLTRDHIDQRYRVLGKGAQ